MTDLRKLLLIGALSGVAVLGSSNTLAGIIDFSFQARAYGEHTGFQLGTAGNVSVSGSYDDTQTDSAGRFLMKSFTWSSDSQLGVQDYSCPDLAVCFNNPGASGFAYFDAVAGTPYMELNDPAHVFFFGTPNGNIYSDSAGFGTWNVADIVEFTFEGTAEGSGPPPDNLPVSGSVSGSGSFDRGATFDGKHPLISFGWDDVDSALGGIANYECNELILCSDTQYRDDTTDDTDNPDYYLFDPVTMLPDFLLRDLTGRSLAIGYDPSSDGFYSDSCCFGDWEITSLTKGGDVNEIPEPTTLALMGLGIAGLGFRRKTK